MPGRKRIAAIVTEYFAGSHADVIITKFLKGFPTDDGFQAPRVDVASIYIDQVSAQDIGVGLAAEHGVPISHAVTLGSPTGQLDGFPAGSHVLSLEHRGDVVPLLDGVANPDSVEQVTVTFESRAGGEGVAAHHGFEAYAEGAALVDASTDPSVHAAVRELHRAGFLGAAEGTEVTSRVFQVVREPQP